jgi:hypothetical protein
MKLKPLRRLSLGAIAPRIPLEIAAKPHTTLNPIRYDTHCWALSDMTPIVGP